MAASSITFLAHNDPVWLGAWEQWPLVEGGFAEAGMGDPGQGYEIYWEADGVKEKIARPTGALGSPGPVLRLSLRLRRGRGAGRTEKLCSAGRYRQA